VPDAASPRHRLTAEETARRLGVKVETVYAYVSRGLLGSVRAADGRTSLFAQDDVDALARRAARGRRRDASARTFGEVATAITLIDDDELYYRGLPVSRLVREHRFEAVAGFLWTESLDADARFEADPAAAGVARAAVSALPARARAIDRLRVAVASAAAADPLRYGTDLEAVTATGAGILAVMVEALPEVGHAAPTPGPGGAFGGSTSAAPPPDVGAAAEPASLADRLWPRLTARPATAPALAALDAALILTADHGLAASTTAARIAASVRADPYAVVQAGLGAVDGPHHGLASALAYRVLAEAHASGDPVAAVAERLRARIPVPGFGHEAGVYPHGDVRARELLLLLREIPEARDVLDTVDGLTRAVSRRPALRPNVDLALAALALSCGMPADAGEAVFAVGRTAGWIAHALEEYEAPPHRFRPRGTYVGRRPA
jgi:citrate synthase